MKSAIFQPLLLATVLASLAACGPQATTPNSTNQTTQNAQSFEGQIQLAMSTYHESDASFQSTSQLKSSGQFRTQQLGLGGVANLDLGASLGNQLQTATSLNVAADTTLNTFKALNLSLASQLQAGGSMAVESDGSLKVNESVLHSRVDSENSQSAVLQLNGEFPINEIDLQLEARLQNRLKPASSSSQLRLQSRNYTALAGEFDSQSSSDANTSFFATHYSGSGTGRDLLLAVRSENNAKLRSDFTLREKGDRFERRGSRRIQFAGDASARTFTSVETRLSSGDTVKIYEERVNDAKGYGSGGGSLKITTQEGGSYTGQIQTMTSADGSLTTYLDSSNPDQPDFLFRENAQGQANFTVINKSKAGSAQSVNMQSMVQTTGTSDFKF